MVGVIVTRVGCSPDFFACPDLPTAIGQAIRVIADDYPDLDTRTVQEELISDNWFLSPDFETQVYLREVVVA
jgi:hypothetical protein